MCFSNKFNNFDFSVILLVPFCLFLVTALPSKVYGPAVPGSLLGTQSQAYWIRICTLFNKTCGWLVCTLRFERHCLWIVLTSKQESMNVLDFLLHVCPPPVSTLVDGTAFMQILRLSKLEFLTPLSHILHPVHQQIVWDFRATHPRTSSLPLLWCCSRCHHLSQGLVL